MCDSPPDVEIPERFEVLDSEALAQRLGYTRATVLTHLSRERFDKIPPPSRRLAMGPIWYLGDVEEWRSSRESQRVDTKIDTLDTTERGFDTPKSGAEMA
jgi:predicted DNA-binding transcriptional regulator AlpA